MAFINLPSVSAPNFKDSVVDFASLPPTGNVEGDVRVTLDTGAIYVWIDPSWVSATGGSGLLNLNGQTGGSQSFAIGTAGSDFAVSSSADTHTFNLPSASATARGVVTTGSQTLAGDKTFNDDVVINGDFPLAQRSETFTLNAGQITAKSVTLARTPFTLSATRLEVLEGPPQFYSQDFSVTGTTLSWNTLGLDGVLVAGDIINVIYN